MLGSSLATILEIPSQADCLKALQVVVQEYDYFIASESKSKMVPYTHPCRKKAKKNDSAQVTSWSRIYTHPVAGFEMISGMAIIQRTNGQIPLFVLLDFFKGGGSKGVTGGQVVRGDGRVFTTGRSTVGKAYPTNKDLQRVSLFQILFLLTIVSYYVNQLLRPK